LRIDAITRNTTPTPPRIRPRDGWYGSDQNSSRNWMSVKCRIAEPNPNKARMAPKRATIVPSVEKKAFQHRRAPQSTGSGVGEP
jgi:hypothetical protein